MRNDDALNLTSVSSAALTRMQQAVCSLLMGQAKNLSPEMIDHLANMKLVPFDKPTSVTVDYVDEVLFYREDFIFSMGKDVEGIRLIAENIALVMGLETFDRKDPLDIVRYFSRVIDNGRTLDDVSRHTKSEVIELDEEIVKVNSGLAEGKDGILGESVDIIACALDAIFLHRPETTNEEITSLLLTKCQKWARRYKDSVDGDRSID